MRKTQADTYFLDTAGTKISEGIGESRGQNQIRTYDDR